jgi:glutamate racemase
MKEYLKRYPDYDYIYLGDQANAPYGNHSQDHVNKLVVHNVDFLAKKGCKLIIIACNTASADALRHIQQIYKGKPAILGVLIPAAEEALKTTRFGNIGVIATRGTIASGAYERELGKLASELYKPTDKRANKSIRIVTQACPLLVPLIEEGMTDSAPTNMILKKYLMPLKAAQVDSLILGCTHYPLLQKHIQRIMGKQCRLVSSSQASVEAIGSYFERHPELERSLSRNGTRTYLTTDDPKRFSELGGRFLGQKIKGERVEILLILSGVACMRPLRKINTKYQTVNPFTCDTLSVFSHENSGRPKWPYEAVFW